MSKAKTSNAKKTVQPVKNAESVASAVSIANPVDAVRNDDTTVVAVPVVKHSDAVATTMKPYLNAYPDAPYFLLSSDGQVFLPANQQDAKVHQLSLDGKKDLVKYVR